MDGVSRMAYEDRYDAISDYNVEQQSEGINEEKERITRYLNNHINSVNKIKHLFPKRKLEFKIKLEIYQNLLSVVEGD